MENFQSILENFYFHITHTSGKNLRVWGSPTDVPRAYLDNATSIFTYFKFEDIVLKAWNKDAKGRSISGSWSCSIRIMQSNKYLTLDWKDEEPVYWTGASDNKRTMLISFSAQEGKEVIWSIQDDYARHYLKADEPNNSHAPVLYKKNEPNADWKITPARLMLEYQLMDIEYEQGDLDMLSPPDKSAGGNTTVANTGENSDKNRTRTDVLFVKEVDLDPQLGVTADDTSTVTKSKVSTFEFGFSQTLAVGATVSTSVSAPFGIADVEAELRVDATFSANQNVAVTTEVEYQFSTAIHVPENEHVKIIGTIDWVDDAEVGFTSTWAVRGFADKINEYAPDGGDPLEEEEILAILISKGFNGTPAKSSFNSSALVKIAGTLIGAFGFHATTKVVAADALSGNDTQALGKQESGEDE
ncbi:MAG: hypothetical protein R3D00_29690 [Bacteroidia bacterium]